jgi:hypothetical protein
MARGLKSTVVTLCVAVLAVGGLSACNNETPPAAPSPQESSMMESPSPSDGAMMESPTPTDDSMMESPSATDDAMMKDDSDS